MGPYVQYLRESVWDFILLAVLASSATVLVESGFVCGDALIAAPVALVAEVVVVLAALYALSYTKRTISIAVVAVPVLSVVALWASTLFWDGAPFEDVAGNPCLALLVAIVTTVAVYLLTRARGGIVALAALGILVCGYVQFIFKENHVAAVVLFFLSCLAAFVYRYYQRTQVLSRRGSSRFGRSFGLCCAGAAAMLALAVAGYGIVAAIDPPTIEPKLLREYIALPEIDMRGIADTTLLDDESRQSEEENDEEELSSNEGDDQSDETEEGAGGEGEGESSPDEVTQENFDESATDAGFMMITYDAPTFPLFVLLIAIVLVAPWLVKLALRRRAYAQICALPPEGQVESLYRFFLKRFDRMKIGRADHLTPTEYAASSAQLLDAFATEDGRDFSDVTDAFVKTYYGGRAPTDDQVGLCHAFYRPFYRNCKRHLGVVGYVLRFFRL